MKKLLIVLVLLAPSLASAQDYYRERDRGRDHGYYRVPMPRPDPRYQVRPVPRGPYVIPCIYEGQCNSQRRY